MTVFVIIVFYINLSISNDEHKCVIHLSLLSFTGAGTHCWIFSFFHINMKLIIQNYQVYIFFLNAEIRTRLLPTLSKLLVFLKKE